jgi:Ca-activated chloride channel family protein
MLYNYLKNLEWNRPEAFWLLLILPVILIAVYRKKKAVLSVSTATPFHESGYKQKLQKIPGILQWISLVCIIFALAQPRTYIKMQLQNTEGIDIVLCLDISGSMNAMDLKPDRLNAAKTMAAEFVRNRVSDRIGFVSFAAEAFTNCPITGNYDFLLNSIYESKTGFLNNGTHIGEGLGTAVSGLEKTRAKSKVVILLTDGMNDPNEQDVSPEAAKQLAKELKIKVYTIGVGTEGMAPTPEIDVNGNRIVVMRPVRIDEVLLQSIAKETGGKYFRAQDNEALHNIYTEINQLEKVKLDVTAFSKYTERFQPFIMASIACLLLGLLLSYSILRVFP